MKKILVFLPAVALLLTTGCEVKLEGGNIVETKTLTCSVDFGSMSSTMEVDFEDDKAVGVSTSTTLVFDSEEEAKAFDNKGDITVSGEIEKREGNKVFLKSSDEDNKNQLEQIKGKSYNEIKTNYEQMGATCK